MADDKIRIEPVQGSDTKFEAVEQKDPERTSYDLRRLVVQRDNELNNYAAYIKQHETVTRTWREKIDKLDLIIEKAKEAGVKGARDAQPAEPTPDPV